MTVSRLLSRTVQVDIPKGSAHKGQDVEFVKWLGGRLDIDECNELVLAAEGSKAQNLGCLERASAVAQDSTGRTLVVKTESAPGIYRITFQSAADARGLTSLADAIEREASEQWEQSRREAAERAETLAREVRASLRGKAPLLYKGVELFGTDPGAEEDVEVLVGSGVLVLLDAPGEGHVGQYELLFYGDEDGHGKAVQTIKIGPSTRMKRRERERTALDDSEEAAITLEISTFGGARRHAVAFDDVGAAAEFQRDFEVRQRVMELAARCAEQEGELARFTNPGILVQFWSRAQNVATFAMVPLAMVAYCLGKWL